ncbi:hypothetical protein LCM20_08865 [Halobacillus litoralis]|uniref:hypothetical protein n=1 Tax=Halobacillus litoralis TaxID=45668 RepID=UPI001CD72BC1|nr:hypothetical protein [Halobacillus litoralis]MCA0970697.1 hypothetical protein [Halobacillus litoralis]
MLYTIHPKRLYLVASILGPFLFITFGWGEASLALQVAVIAGVLIGTVMISLVRFSCEIQAHSLYYRISFLKKTLFEKEIKAEDISSIKFFRSGMNEKAATVYREGGRKVRFVVFKVHHAYDLLEAFGDVNDVKMMKTKNYIMLQRAG